MRLDYDMGLEHDIVPRFIPDDALKGYTYSGKTVLIALRRSLDRVLSCGIFPVLIGVVHDLIHISMTVGVGRIVYSVILLLQSGTSKV